MALNLQTPDRDTQRRKTWLGAAVAALALVPMATSMPWAFWLLPPMFVLAGWLSTRRSFGSRLLAHGLWWQGVLQGTLLGVAGQDAHYVGAGMMMLIGSALALHGSHHPSQTEPPPPESPFQPVAFKGLLTASMTLAISDMMGLLIFGGLSIEPWGSPVAGAALMTMGVVMAVAVYGLYRLRVWGMGLNLLANLLIAALVTLGGAGSIEPMLALWLMATTTLQFALNAPVLRAMWRSSAASTEPPQHAAASAAHAPTSSNDERDAEPSTPQTQETPLSLPDERQSPNRDEASQQELQSDALVSRR